MKHKKNAQHIYSYFIKMEKIEPDQSNTKHPY